MMVLNAGVNELKSWQVFIEFQHDEILMSASGAVLADANDLLTKVGNKGTTFVGYPNTDLKTAIEVAGNFTQMQANVELKGAWFGLKKGSLMPKTIRLVSHGCTFDDVFTYALKFAARVLPSSFSASPKNGVGNAWFTETDLGVLVLQYRVGMGLPAASTKIWRSWVLKTLLIGILLD
ncbi:hypothetical protein U1Q18_037347 [Sarracenia purpurea var. burkii]